MVKKKRLTSKHKIADKWETEPCEIVSQRSEELPVYTVFRNDRDRTLHHNILFVLGLQHDTESILNDTEESEILGNPVVVLLQCGSGSFKFKSFLIKFRIWNNSLSSDVLYIQASISISPKYEFK